jgi:hypothetical protein
MIERITSTNSNEDDTQEVDLRLRLDQRTLPIILDKNV